MVVGGINAKAAIKTYQNAIVCDCFQSRPGQVSVIIGVRMFKWLKGKAFWTGAFLGGGGWYSSIYPCTLVPWNPALLIFLDCLSHTTGRTVLSGSLKTGIF